MGRHPEHAAQFHQDMARLDPAWETSKTQAAWSRYLSISSSTFHAVKNGTIRYSDNLRRRMQEKIDEQDTPIETTQSLKHITTHRLPTKIEDYLLQQDASGRYVLTRVVATFADRKEAELFTNYLGERFK